MLTRIGSMARQALTRKAGLQRGGTGLVAGAPKSPAPSSPMRPRMQPGMRKIEPMVGGGEPSVVAPIAGGVGAGAPIKSDPSPVPSAPMVGAGATGAPAPALPSQAGAAPQVQSPSGLTPVPPSPSQILPSPTSPASQEGGEGESDYYRLGHGFLEDYDKSQQGYNRELYRGAGQALSRAGIGGSGMAADQINKVTQDIDENRLKFAYGATQDERDFRMRKVALEDALAGNAFNRDASRAGYLGAYDPRALMGASQQAGADAEGSFSDLASLIQQMIASRGQPVSGSPLPPRTPSVIPDIRK
jgi:hypothetical protein